MSFPKDCPYCRRVNPGEAVLCDCGYDFVIKRHVKLRWGPPTESAAFSLLAIFLILVGCCLGIMIGVPLAIEASGPHSVGCGLVILDHAIPGFLIGGSLG